MPVGKRISALDADGKVVKNQADGVQATDGATKGQLDAAATAARSRANHTGTQTAATISDFDAQTRSSRLDQFAAPTNPVGLNSQRITSIAQAVADTDAAQWGQIKDLLSGARKTDVRLVNTAASPTLSGLSAIDGITPVAGDRILVPNAGVSAGIYVAASGAWSRALDADQSAEFATQWLVTVAQGTANGDTLWQHATDGTVTLGTTTLSFTKIGPISTAVETGVAANFPATSAGGAWAWTHGLGTRDILVAIYRNSSPWDEVDCYMERTDANTVTFKPDDAISAGAFRVVARKAVV